MSLKNLISRQISKKLKLNIFHAPTRKINYGEMKVFSYCSRMYEQIEDTDGDIVECGVGKGGTMLFWCFLANQEGLGRRVWGFDSFEGFPEPSEKDSSPRNPKKGEWSDTSVSHIYATLERADVDSSNLKLIKGFFSNSLKEYDGKSIALLHIDVDLYEAYIEVLEYMFPLVKKGGVVCFDEYNDENWPGATIAINEFLKKTNQTLRRDKFTGKHYLVKE